MKTCRFIEREKAIMREWEKETTYTGIAVHALLAGEERDTRSVAAQCGWALALLSRGEGQLQGRIVTAERQLVADLHWEATTRVRSVSELGRYKRFASDLEDGHNELGDEAHAVQDEGRVSTLHADNDGLLLMSKWV